MVHDGPCKLYKKACVLTLRSWEALRLFSNGKIWHGWDLRFLWLQGRNKLQWIDKLEGRPIWRPQARNKEHLCKKGGEKEAVGNV